MSHVSAATARGYPRWYKGNRTAMFHVFAARARGTSGGTAATGPKSLFPVPYSQFPISPAPDYRPIFTGPCPPAHVHRPMSTGVCSPVPVHRSLFAGRESQVLVRQFFTRRLAASERLLENPNACTTVCGGIRQQSPQVGASRSCRIASETQLRTVVSDKTYCPIRQVLHRLVSSGARRRCHPSPLHKGESEQSGKLLSPPAPDKTPPAPD
jgi:hypothetical protein